MITKAWVEITGEHEFNQNNADFTNKNCVLTHQKSIKIKNGDEKPWKIRSQRKLWFNQKQDVDLTNTNGHLLIKNGDSTIKNHAKPIGKSMKNPSSLVAYRSYTEFLRLFCFETPTFFSAIFQIMVSDGSCVFSFLQFC